MGRTSKFTFPVPGKRQKHQSTIGPIVSNPMSKAQRILGAAELNIDAPKAWDDSASSASGISVSVSDHTSTAYTATERGGGYRRTEDVNRWEMESETVPAHVQAGRGLHGDDTIREYMSDASSMRRRQSNSTLKSWYDKSKMPLSISQQTSSSAMAKGVPTKATALLDFDGGSMDSGASVASTAKVSRRPSRLNLSHLLHGSRHRDQHHLQPSPSSGSLRSQDFSRSPSAASSSYSPDTLVTSPRTPRRLLKKPTKEQLAAEAAAAAAAAVDSASVAPRRGSASTTQSDGGSGVAAPRDLYDHYERTAFRDILESPAEEYADPFDEEAAATKLLISDFPVAPVGPTPLRSPSYPRNSTTLSNPVIKEPCYEEKRWDPHNAPSDAPTKVNNSSSYSLPRTQYHPAAPDNDYASSLASVSSRHTKTSKASKRTNPSITESDRQERSVLSLSSDSEEDYDEDGSADTASKSSSFGRSIIDAPPSPASVSRKSVGSRGGESVSDTASRKSGKRASFAATHTYLTVPAGSAPSNLNLKPTVINPRTSSVNRNGGGSSSQHTQSPQSTPSSRSTARMSTMSSSSYSSAEWQKAASAYGVHEAKAVAVHAVASTVSSLQSVAEASDTNGAHQQHHSQRQSLQPTPPLSPSSVEFCLQPDMSFDVAENSSSHNGRGGSSGGGENGGANTGGHNPRFMAVTRQEQMLLAALRNKRAMMRENILAEFEGETPSHYQHEEGHQQHQHVSKGFHKHTSSQATIRGPQTDSEYRPHLRHQVSSTSTSTITSDSRAAEKRREATSSASSAKASPASHHRVRSGSRGTRSNAGDYSSPGASSSRSNAREARSHTSLSGSRRQHHQGSSPIRDRGAATFDDIPSEEEYDHAPYSQHAHHREVRQQQQQHSRSSHHGISSASASTRSRSSSSKASSVRHRPAQEAKRNQQQRVLEEEELSPTTDMPRSDSPIAAAQMLAPPMDRKKAVRLSAVGRAGPEVGWWGDDG